MRNFAVVLSLILLASFGAAQKQDLLSMPTNVGLKFTCSKTYQSDSPIVKVIGDVNGDLISDFAVGFPNVDAGSGTAAGLVAIIYGGSNMVNGLDVCTFTDISVGFRIRGSASSKFGANIVSMGDLNKDGSQDIAVAAPAYGGVGRVYVIYMPAISLMRKSDYSVSSLNTYTLTSITGGAQLGTYLADPVDYNGDGLKDVLIGNAANDANAYILFGNAARGGDIASNNLNPFVAVTLQQDPSTAADAGFARLPVASCADFNQDTTPDYVIMGFNNIFILYGSGMRASSEIVTVSNINGEIIPLGSPSLTFSSTKSVTCADLDMDGRQDLVLSLSDGNVHVLYGSTIKALSASTVNAKTFNQGFIITQIAGSSTFGQVLKRTDGWNGYGQDVLLISEPTSSNVYALYASSGAFNASSGMTSFVIDNLVYPQQGFKVWTQDGTLKLGSTIDATYDINGDGVKDLLLAEGVSYNSYAFYGQCQTTSGCACPNNLKYMNGQCVNWGLSGGQKVGIIIGVISGALLLIALGVLILKKTSCGANCFESYAKPAHFGSHTHAPIPQTMATSA